MSGYRELYKKIKESSSQKLITDYIVRKGRATQNENEVCEDPWLLPQISIAETVSSDDEGEGWRRKTCLNLQSWFLRQGICLYTMCLLPTFSYLRSSSNDEMCNLYVMYYTEYRNAEAGQSRPALEHNLAYGNSHHHHHPSPISYNNLENDPQSQFNPDYSTTNGVLPFGSRPDIAGVLNNEYMYQEAHNWPSKNLELGQVAAVTVDHDENVVIFHRGILFGMICIFVKFAPVVRPGHQRSLVDAVAFTSYPRHARLERSGWSRKCLTSWYYKKEQYQNQNVIDLLLCCKCASNDDQKGPTIERNGTPDHNTWLRACVACNSEQIGTLLWGSPDTSSMIVRTRLAVGFVTKHCTSLVSMIPNRSSQAPLTYAEWGVEDSKDSSSCKASLRLVEGEQRLQAPDHLHIVFLQNWGVELSKIVLSSASYLAVAFTANNRHKTSLCDNEFHQPPSDTVNQMTFATTTLDITVILL
ncbi:peptidyl-glycine alpha-amidating monooxygenase A [Trichonephila clavipes]|uniref:Peptidyl-glycine alpha-amidating monooxygenase A n=1 Tax=Trichonephila clavipes TaxID=2585209 RepID=A0A8X6VX40_TRICX|nr:peptidyl-glycine alpha-amidating monooxygenase A [Trichonephila clavipes]